MNAHQLADLLLALSYSIAPPDLFASVGIRRSAVGGQGLGRYNAYGMAGYQASRNGQGKGLDVKEIDHYYEQYMTLYRNAGAGNSHLLTGGNNAMGGRNFGVQNNNNNINNSSAGVNGGDGAGGGANGTWTLNDDVFNVDTPCYLSHDTPFDHILSHTFSPPVPPYPNTPSQARMMCDLRTMCSKLWPSRIGNDWITLSVPS